MKYLSGNIYFLRTLNKWTQAETAASIDVKKTTFNNWENNVAVPDLSKLIDLATLFRVTLDDLTRIDISKNVHLIQNPGDKKNGKNVHLNVHHNVPGHENSMVNEPQSELENAKDKQVQLLILERLNTLVKEVGGISKKLGL